jgi:hypothetical protein
VANFSNYAESGILNFLFRGNSNSFTRPLEIAVALCSNVPTESQHGGTIPEVANAGSYARANLGAPTNSLFGEVTQNPSDSGLIENSSDITFTTATANWGWVSGIAITDSGVYGAGQVLLYGALTTPREVLSGDTFRLSAGNIDIYIG